MMASKTGFRDEATEIVELAAAAIAFPQPEIGVGTADTFKLSSHAGARDALDFALSIGGPGFNAFVLGEDRCGRMSTTIDYLRSRQDLPHLKRLDWLYLTNFWMEREPYA